MTVLTVRHAHYLQHVAFEGLGSIETWLKDADYQISSSPLFESPELPNPNQVDFLIIMGGPMSVNDERDYPWLVAEKRFIREFIATGKPMLGICLGAQLIACALGARVYRNHEKEIGWFPVQGLAMPDSNTFRFPGSTEVFHWHGETFDLPKGASCIAESAVCRHQAFQIGRAVIGFQFHLETTPESAQAIVSNCRDELIPAAYIQTEVDILSASNAQYRTINGLMSEVLEFLHTGSSISHHC
ncbi:MAG: gamma-glutamyl-gamma-aminobutyrate hydrolase family protein [Candidatus Thiodiazotropha sp. (ex Myrtea spinifera)]|nr:gamma-glutamyl-gamma-aminobutyrate hydrolase family protein [Candidatus Thiodiazotropha sp. (ex Myrtea spinifera)]